MRLAVSLPGQDPKILKEKPSSVQLAQKRGRPSIRNGDQHCDDEYVLYQGHVRFFVSAHAGKERAHLLDSVPGGAPPKQQGSRLIQFPLVGLNPLIADEADQNETRP
jgi:hypothetical protein